VILSQLTSHSAEMEFLNFLLTSTNRIYCGPYMYTAYKGDNDVTRARRAIGQRNYGHHLVMTFIRTTTLTVMFDTYLVEHSCRILSRSDLKRRSVGLFLISVAPTRTRRRRTRRITVCMVSSYHGAQGHISQNSPHSSRFYSRIEWSGYLHSTLFKFRSSFTLYSL